MVKVSLRVTRKHLNDGYWGYDGSSSNLGQRQPVEGYDDIDQIDVICYDDPHLGPVIKTSRGVEFKWSDLNKYEILQNWYRLVNGNLDNMCVYSYSSYLLNPHS